MGGWGSTRWAYHGKKTTVEDCTILSISGLIEKALEHRSGSITWSIGGETFSSVGYSLLMRSAGLLLVLNYTFTTGGRAGQSVELPIHIQTTEPYFGGLRYWFTCPLAVSGQPCRRRVARLYRPPGAVYFGCRHCYDLTYASAQEAHKYDRSGDMLLRALAQLDRLSRAGGWL